MKRSVILIIILAVILILDIPGFFVYRYYKINTDLNWCMSDSDCKIHFSSCSCDTYCGNTNTERNDCARACSVEESKSSVTSCACVRNQCKDATPFQELRIQKAEIGKVNISAEPVTITVVRGADNLRILSIIFVFTIKQALLIIL